MPRDLNAEPIFPIADIQGDILAGLAQRCGLLLFFKIEDPRLFKTFLKTLHITSMKECLEQRDLIKRRKEAGIETLVPTPGLNVAFTHKGLMKLGVEGIDGEQPTLEAFRDGMAARTAKGKLTDPDPATWNFPRPGHRPDGVFILTGASEAEIADTVSLRLAPVRGNGWPCMKKIALVRDGSLFTMVESFGPALIASGFREHAEVGHLILGRSIELMLEELEPNCFEDSGYRRLVDFGHTFSPLLEAKSGYRIAHGEAVAMSSAIAVEMGMLDWQSCRRIVALLRRLGLPVQSPLADIALMRQAMLDTTLHRDGSANLVVPTSVGSADFVTSHVEVTDMILNEAGKAVAHLAELEEGIRVPSFS